MNVHANSKLLTFRFLIPVFIMFLSYLLPCVSVAIPLLQGQVTNLMAAHETAAESLKFIAGEERFPSGASFSSSGQFAANSWDFNVNGVANGQALSLSFSGALTGDFGSDITVGFTGVGNYGRTPFSSSGQVVLLFDAAKNDYFVAHYDDAMTYGSGTVSRTVRGAELIGGVIVGSYIGGWRGAFEGATVGWFLSDIVDKLIIGPNPPLPPVRPAPPANPPRANFPKSPPIMVDQEFSKAVIVGNNINIVKNRGNVIYSKGTLNSVNGRFQGNMSVPEPAVSWLFLTGLGILGPVVRRRKNALHRWNA